MNITQLVSPYFSHRLKEIEKYSSQAEALQNKVLKHLIQKTVNTEWGKRYDYKHIQTYNDFQKVPIQTYEEAKGYIDRMRHGEKDVLWPGEVIWYAKSSGTTNDKSKFIPVSKEGLHDIHYAGGKDAVALYLGLNPKSRMFSGKGLILGGSHTPNYNVQNSLVGDLSAILIENINPLVNFVRTPQKEIALLSDFEEKREKIARLSMNENVTNLSGVPSWMLAVLKRIVELKGTDNLADVWPNLEIFFHGGVAFTPYREQYKQLIRSDKMHYLETYNASEGFFGLQNEYTDSAMLLMIDYGIFYEFIPMDEFGNEHPTIVPLSGVELNKNYAMVISTTCGLWRYIIGDTIKFTSKAPYKFIISGRTKHYINAFGEELMVDNAEQGLAKACTETGAQVSEYTAAPVFMDANAKCRHQWLIEFTRMPDSVKHFAEVLDKALQEINSDYEAKRHKDITLQPLEIIVARTNLFNDWLKSKNKLGGQHKIPRLSNSREYIEEILKKNY
ncbi:MAG: GH3 auxin-responsive promoter family protein [Phocaeicola sp.]|uniref:GH3 auxin-responsive promoter family protein n=1 Tax=Phocaeicola TaxID=909656 RepID=UPI00234F3E5E|nr:GH3 auxin-responsive promoter family protein [Phocaeicola oris]MCE2616920.1 GH3 auxin-responsive promoter family protein [Phocaeicola oris]